MILNVFTDGFTHDSKLLLIGVRTHTGEYRFWDNIEKFIDYFLDTDDKIIIGYNILKFDLTFLLLKAKSLDKFGEFFKKVNYSNVIDLFNILTFKNNGIIKGLGYYLEQNGIKNDFISDLNIKRNIGNKDVSQDIKKKLSAINELYWKIKGENNG